MTAKEKAIDLKEKMYNHTSNSAVMGRLAAIACAKITVDEVLSTFSIFAGDQNGREYWQEVKKEINEL